MQELTKLIMEDMKPAFGVTEPAAIAYCVACAAGKCEGIIKNVTVKMNSGMYKNAFSCGIPFLTNVGSVYAAALGIVAKNPDKKLQILENLTSDEIEDAYRYIKEDKIKIQCTEITSTIYIEATVTTNMDICTAIIQKEHTNLVSLIKNGEEILERKSSAKGKESNDSVKQPYESLDIHSYTLREIFDYVNKVPLEEIRFIMSAYQMNYELALESIADKRTTYSKLLLKENNNKLISDSALPTAQLLCNAAIEGRVIGINKSAMSITGSGSHGILCTMPLYAYGMVNHNSEDKLLRAGALSFLITMYIKEYSGKLSAFCGCGIAGGTGMACGLAFLMNADYDMLNYVIQNMACTVTGMICHGGNYGCTLKGITAVDAAFRAASFAKEKIYIEYIHGICDKKPENTLKNMGRIASPGMVYTEQVILDILNEKEIT